MLNLPSPEKAKVENRFNCWLRWKLQQTEQSRGFALESKIGRELKAYSPVFIHNCLEKCIGSYKSCSPLRNGNLIVKCCSVQQMTTLLQCTKLKDGAVSVEIAASSLRPLGARGVIYNAPLELHTRSRGMPCKSRG